jgi:hypothetical protein
MTDAMLLAALQTECISCARARVAGLLVIDGVHFIEDEADEEGGYCADCPVCMPLETEAKKRGYRTRGLFGDRIDPLREDGDVTMIWSVSSEGPQ